MFTWGTGFDAWPYGARQKFVRVPKVGVCLKRKPRPKQTFSRIALPGAKRQASHQIPTPNPILATRQTTLPPGMRIEDTCCIQEGFSFVATLRLLLSIYIYIYIYMCVCV